MTGVRHIPLTRERVAVVDEADYAELSRHRWHYGSGYAMRTEIRDGRKVTVMMHRVVNGTPDGFDTDHINRDGLDNTRANLRTATHSQNLWNTSPRAGGSSRFVGVGWHKRAGKWRAYTRISGANKHLGLFDSEVEAARARDAAALKHHGEFAFVNGV